MEFLKLLNLPQIYSLVRNLAHIIPGILILVPSFIIFLVTTFFAYIFRSIVILLAKLQRPDLHTCMSGLTNGIFVTDWFKGKSPRCNIIVQVIFQGHLTQDDVEDAVLRRWIKAKRIDNDESLEFPQFQQYPYKWLGGFTFWRNDPKFDVKNHLFLEKGESEVDLNKLCEKLLNEGFHQERSPWELHLIQNCRLSHFEKDGPLSVLIFKVHHCLADGYSIVSAFVEGLLEKPLESFELPNIRDPHKNRSLASQVTDLLLTPVIGLYDFWKNAQYAMRESPWKLKDSQKTGYMYIAKSELIEIEKIKIIKNRFQVSFTAVLVSAISAAITDHLNNKKDDKIRRKDDSMLFTSMLPLPRDKKERLTNRVAFAIFPVPTTMLSFSSSVDRLKEIDCTVESIKSSVIPKATNILANLMCIHNTKVADFLASNRYISTGLSNMYTIPNNDGVMLAGKQALFVDTVVGCMEGVSGAAFMVVSCCSHIRLAVAVEKAIMTREEAAQMVQGMEKEIDQLFNLAIKYNHNDNSQLF